MLEIVRHPSKAVYGWTMGDIVEFASNGNNASGYLALPEGGSGPGVIVIQEWWGLDSGIKEMADRLATAGFVALAPDLYHGELAGHTEMDKAGELMNAMPADRAGRDMSGAIDFLADHHATSNNGIGVVGFCMGGMLTFILAALRPDQVKAAVPFYGYPSGDSQPDYSKIEASIQGHMAEHDDFFTPSGAMHLQEELTALGKDVDITVHLGTGHAFMAPHNALGTQDEAKVAEIWPKVTSFLHDKLG
jgi:carboxymethylenebutenolidase